MMSSMGRRVIGHASPSATALASDGSIFLFGRARRIAHPASNAPQICPQRTAHIIVAIKRKARGRTREKPKETSSRSVSFSLIHKTRFIGWKDDGVGG